MSTLRLRARAKVETVAHAPPLAVDALLTHEARGKKRAFELLVLAGSLTLVLLPRRRLALEVLLHPLLSSPPLPVILLLALGPLLNVAVLVLLFLLLLLLLLLLAPTAEAPPWGR